MLETLLRFGKKIIPTKIFTACQPFYHRLLAFFGAFIYRFPSRNIKIVAVTGTKGKSTTVELVNAVLEEAGHATAVLGTIRFKIGDATRPNLYKMTIPGRFFVHKFLRDAVDAGCDWAVLEMTSEGVKQFRHKHIHFDALVFTNLSPEHIESHGSFENYRDAKRELGKVLSTSRKKEKTIIANADDPEGSWYLGLPVEHTYPFSLKHAEPFTQTDDGFNWTFRDVLIHTHLPGTFNLANMLAAATFGISQNISVDILKHALEDVKDVRGRVEYVDAGQGFNVVVDYAHTPDSLEKFYSVFPQKKNHHNICILGNTGGGRDTWKRPEMAHIAENACNRVILTNEDPYDEDPEKIISEMAAGIQDSKKLKTLLDRREAFRTAFEEASDMHNAGKTTHVLITGKGTDPYIMGPNGSKEEWDDATVAREELKGMLERNRHYVI